MELIKKVTEKENCWITKDGCAMDEIINRLKEIKTPEKQLKAVAMFLLVICNNDTDKVCEALDKYKILFNAEQNKAK